MIPRQNTFDVGLIDVWPFLVLSRKIVEHFLFPRLSPPGDRRCDVLSFVSASCVSSSTALQILRDASHW